MNNLLSQVENNLRHIVKKHKNISFSIGLTLVYLMVGLSVFSEENIIKFENKIASKEKINKSIINLKEELYRIKIENNKKIKMSNFELQELMKQGDQVIKSPWASWQFGINFMYNNWDGSYKGKGDKKKEPIIYQREKNKFKKIEIKNYSYGTTTIRNIEEPFSIIPIEPSIRLRGIDKKNVEIILPSIKKIEKFTKNIQTDTAEVIRPVISDSPEINIQIPVPNSKPFIDYAAQAERYNSDKYREFFKPLLYSWTGFQPDIEKNGEEFLVKETGKYVTSSEDVFIANPTVKSNGFRNPRGTHRYFYVKMDAIGTDKEVIEGIIVPTVEGGHEKNGNIENFKFFIAGNIENTGKISASKSGVTVATDGVIGFHVVTNSMFKNIDVFLKGRAAFISAESWQTPKIAFDNINVRIDRQENTLFYWYPGKYYKMFVDSSSNSKNRRGTLIGNINADFISKGNTVYSIVGLVGANNILSEGKYKLEGSNNIVFSNLGYNPNFQNFIGKNGINDKYKTGMTPIVNLKTPVESYGDDNVIMYFSDLIPDGTVDYPKTDRWDNIMHDEKWEKTKIGIYQGEVGIAANIGEKLAIDENLTQQTDEGKVYDNNYVENNVGILAQSGQRKGIIPSKDLGAEKYYGDGSFKPLNFANGEYEDLGNGRQYKEIKTDKIYNYRIMDHSFADADKIHALYVNDINVTFGKYSKNGIAIVADRGTQIDVAIAGNYATKDGDKSRIKIRTTPIIDYNMNSLSYTNDNKLISSYNEVNNEAATGTVYALAKGKWKDSLTRMDSKESIDPSSPHGLSYRKGMSEETINSLKDLGSEINIGQDLEISAKYKKK